jgi:hypothetical protein
LAALDDANDGHARTELAGLRRHAHRAYVASLEGLQDSRRSHAHWPGAKIFEKQAGVLCSAIFDSGRYAGGDGAASFVSNESDVFAGADTEASLHGVLGAGHQLWVWVAKVHLSILQEFAEI